jgi:hypothetical protein
MLKLLLVVVVVVFLSNMMVGTSGAATNPNVPRK